MNDTSEGRAIERVVEIDAPTEAVWRAISEAEELVRWFPPEARVEPGVGGKVWMSWGEGDVEAEAPITAWEAGRRLAITYSVPDAETGELRTLGYELEIEGRGGRTRLRLVHGGFGSGPGWDGLYDGTARGWDLELGGLRHYLERHRGTPRTLVRARRRDPRPADELWGLVWGRRGLDPAGTLGGSPGAGAAGRAFALRARDLDLAGTFELVRPPAIASGVVPALGEAYLRVMIHDQPYGAPGTNEVNLWLSLYGVDGAERAAAALEGVLDDALGGAPSP